MKAEGERRKTTQYWVAILLLVVVLSGCTIDLSQTPTPGFVTATLPSRPTTAAPILPWTSLGLSGRLVYVTAQQDGDSPSMDIRLLDLISGTETVLFHSPPAGTVHSVTVSPDATQIIMSYAPPPGADQSSHQELYQMPLDGSQPPTLFLPPPTPDDEYLHPEWSPDGHYIYFAHVNYQRPPRAGQHYPVFTLYRTTYPSGQPEKLAEEAYWPRLSPDMSRLVYITLDPLTGKNKLFLANADGSAAALTLIGPAPLDILDAPLFAPDGDTLLFSVPVPENVYEPAAPSWIEKIFGVSVASAHVVPSEWWSAPLTGGPATQLTQIQAVGLFGSVSPDGKYIASYSGAGVFVMNPDGTGLTMLVKNVGGMPGTVRWIP